MTTNHPMRNLIQIVEGDQAPPADYMNGQCHVFAVAMHRALGFSFLVLLDKTERYAPGIFAVYHVLAVDRAGTTYDINGRGNAAEIVAQWQVKEHSMSRPGVVKITSESSLRKYVEKTADGWDLPLSHYTEADVIAAMKAACAKWGKEFPALCAAPNCTPEDQQP